MEKRILCYGDSNTWGYTPLTAQRYDRSTRWTSVLASLLGEGYTVIEDGLGGRTTVWDDPYIPYRNGLEGLPYALLTARPLDLVIVMLGTNDLTYTDAFGYYRGLSQIVHHILNAGIFYKDSAQIYTGPPKILLLSPITLHPDMAQIQPEHPARDKYPESCRFAEYTQRLAREYHLPWLDAAQYASPSPADAIHMLPEGHICLAHHLAPLVRQLLSE